MKRVLKAPRLTLGDLDSELMERFNLAGFPPQLSDAMRALSFQLPILGEVAIPAGIPVSWITALPLKSRLRNALGRYYLPRERVIENPLLCSELIAIPAHWKRFST